MLVTKYKIEHISSPEEGHADIWRIDIELTPQWFDRWFMGQVFPLSLSLVGSCLTWSWVPSNRKANFFWSVWADCAVKKHKKDHGKTYVYRRHTQP